MYDSCYLHSQPYFSLCGCISSPALLVLLLFYLWLYQRPYSCSTLCLAVPSITLHFSFLFDTSALALPRFRAHLSLSPYLRPRHRFHSIIHFTQVAEQAPDDPCIAALLFQLCSDYKFSYPSRQQYIIFYTLFLMFK